MKRWAHPAAAFLLAGLSLSAQQSPTAPERPSTSSANPTAQPPTFAAGVNAVEVDAIVTDRQGHFIPGLTKHDFRVLEDGTPQPIATFALVNVPETPPESAPHGAGSSASNVPVEPDVASNAQESNGRLYVMLIDDLHTDPAHTARVKAAAGQFVDQNLGPDDLMAVLHTIGARQANQEFTADKALLLAAIDKTIGQKLRSATLNKTDEFFNRRGFSGPPEPLNDPDDAQRSANARATLDTLRSVATWLGSVHNRRKAILFVSEGLAYDIDDLVPKALSTHREATDVLDATRSAIDAAMRANVAIYGIDPRGLTDVASDDITVQTYPDFKSSDVGTGSLANEVELSQDSLIQLSKETGGFAVVNRNQYATAYGRIVADNSAYYVLAYDPASEKRDGKFHRITVQVDAPPGATVRARRGYWAPKGTVKDPSAAGRPGTIDDVLKSPIPVSGLTLDVFAAPFKGPALPNASVLLGAELQAQGLPLTAGDRVEFAYMVIDASGQVRNADSNTVTLKLDPQSRARTAKSGVRLLTRMYLTPGRYQVRVAARDALNGKAGSVFDDIEVPDFAKAPLALSGIVVTSALGAFMPTIRPDETLGSVLPGPPVGLRAFPQNDTAVAYGEVYDNQVGPAHKVEITISVVTDGSGEALFRSAEERDSAELHGKPGAYRFRTRIPMKDFPVGGYVLAIATTSNGSTATRRIPISVTAPAALTVDSRTNRVPDLAGAIR